jgi:glycosyltransferase involved in cell wall biosynthesis
MLSISLVTLGDPNQLTGGYLFHRRMAEAAPGHDARIRFVSFPAWPFPSPIVRGRAVLAGARAGADVVLVDSIAAAFLAPWLAWPGVSALAAPVPVPVAAIAHQPPGGIDHGAVRTRVQAGLDRLAYRRMARIVAASEALAEEFVAQGFARNRVTVVAPGRDVAPTAIFSSGAARPGEDLRAGRLAALLCVGNWVARKGTLPLLEALARLPAEAVTLHLVGRDDAEPAYAARVRARLAAPDLAGRVVIHGSVDRERVAELYEAADIFVLPSTREPYGTVYGEAMAAGLPVVGWRSGNLVHLAGHNREGLLLTPGDIDGLAAALRRLAEDEPLRRRLGQAARRRAESFPTWAESAAALFGLLRELAAGGGVSRVSRRRSRPGHRPGGAPH